MRDEEGTPLPKQIGFGKKAGDGNESCKPSKEQLWDEQEGALLWGWNGNGL